MQGTGAAAHGLAQAVSGRGEAAGWLRTSRGGGGAEASGTGRRAATPTCHSFASARASQAPSACRFGAARCCRVGTGCASKVTQVGVGRNKCRGPELVCPGTAQGRRACGRAAGLADSVAARLASAALQAKERAVPQFPHL